MTFRNFLADMEMGDIVFRGEAFTWANNKEGGMIYTKEA